LLVGSGIINCDECVAERSHTWTDYWNCDGRCTLASMLSRSLKISGIWFWLHRVYMFLWRV